MATKKKTKNKAKVAGVEEVSYVIDLKKVRDSPRPLQEWALVCMVDHQKRWPEKSGMIMAAMPRIAKLAAILCSGTRCFFCGTAQVPANEKTLFDFQPEYPLCECLMRLRSMPYDYIEGWHTPEGNKKLLEQDEAGTVSRETPVYQFMCGCGAGPNVVNAGLVIHGLEQYKKHRRLTRCEKCQKVQRKKMAQIHARRPHNTHSTPLKAPIQAIIEKPRTGPEGKIHKNKKNKPGEGAHSVFIPTVLQPLSALEAAPETPPT